MDEESMARYAWLVVKLGVDLRPGQELYVRGERVHRELAHRIGEAGYDLGAGRVHYRFGDPLRASQLVRRADPDEIAFFHEQNQAWYAEVVESGSPCILVGGREIPHLLGELARTHPHQHRAFVRPASEAIVAFYRQAVDRGRFPLTEVAGATPAWARSVFPQLEAAAAMDRLWQLIFRFTHADQENAPELLAVEERVIQARKRALTELGIREIRVTGGGNDLRLGFSDKARWEGGPLTTGIGQRFYPNFPTYEIFTTPDCRLTAGRLVATMPFRIRSGVLVKDLALTFRDGEIVDFDADAGKEAFGSWLAVDAGARRLGEFALVGQDSPIARNQLFFDFLAFDESASSHVGLGQALTLGLEGGEAMAEEEREELGWNQSVIHTDVMFGSTEVKVVATRSQEGQVVLMDQGCWSDRFLGVSASGKPLAVAAG